MSTSIAQNIDALCQEKGVDREIVIEAMKEAVRAAARKQFRSGEDIQVDWNPETGIELSASKVVVDEVADPATELSLEEAREMAGDDVEIGDALLLPLPMEELGRIAAQTAKQILFQKVRDAERSNIYDQYIDKIGDLANGFTKRFEMEVPEIYDETVVIKSAVREPGERAKIAVTSNERDVDPVGACVGMKGSRVQAIIRELRGEKIDIIEWSDEPSVFAANALSPAKVNQVRITDIENRQMEVIVNEDQLSLAIGKRGQNVRLATKLVGWNIDIRSEEELKKEVAEQMGALIASGGSVPLSAIEGVTAAQAETLAEHGVNDIDALASTTVDDLVEYLDVSLDEAESMLNAAQAVIAAREASKQSAVAEEAAAAEGAGEEIPAESASDEETEEASADSESEETTTAEETAAPEETTTITEQHAVSAEFDPTIEADEVKPSNAMTNEGYDEAVDQGEPFSAEPEILAENSADPVALTEAEPISEDELLLQEAGRDLRPDTITPSPDITSTGAAMIEAAGKIGEGEPPVEEDAGISPRADFASEASAPEVQTSSAPEPSSNEAETVESDENEKQSDASEDNAAQ